MSGDVFDLDAVVAEGEQIPFRFQFGGEEYELPSQLDVVAAAAMEEGDLSYALRRMIGEAQWARMKAADAVFDTPRLKALMEAYAGHCGASMGESLASTGSFANTGRPSKPTSNGITRSR